MGGFVVVVMYGWLGWVWLVDGDDCLVGDGKRFVSE